MWAGTIGPFFCPFSTFPSPDAAAGAASAARSNRKLKKALLEDNGAAGGRAPARRWIAEHLCPPAGLEPAGTAKPYTLHPTSAPIPTGSPGLGCRCHLFSTAHVACPIAAPVPALGDRKNHPQPRSWSQMGGPGPLSSPSVLCRGDPTASDALPGRSRTSPSLRAYACSLRPCSEGSCHPNPG